MIPPSEWHMNIKGLLEASASCHNLSAHVWVFRGIHTARSASNCATSVCACWSIRSEDVLPRNDVAFALYPNVRIREFLTALGSNFLSFNQQIPALVVQFLNASPFKPWTATILRTRQFMKICYKLFGLNLLDLRILSLVKWENAIFFLCRH